jgi:aminoglycoside 2'-N-acetyltransferase I
MTQIQVVRSEDLSPERLDEIRALLMAAFDDGFNDDDWNHTLGGWHVVATDKALVAHAAVVERVLDVGGRAVRAGYVEGVAATPTGQGEGLGSWIMGRVAQLLEAEFELGALSTGRHAFYERLGWERWRGPTFVRDGPNVVRTADEDDGIMVLRYSTTSNLDLSLPISCETRPGDAW